MRWLKMVRSASMVAVLLVVSAVPPAHAEQPDAGHFYMFNKERIPLGLDTGRIAVFQEPVADRAAGADDRLADLARSLAPFGFDETALKAHAWPGWTYARLPDAAARQAEQGVAEIVARLADARAGDFVSPVFIDEYGPRLVARDILIGFEADITHEQADEFVAQLGMGRIISREFAGMPGVYHVRSESRNGFEVLAKANEAALRPEVRFAEPDMVFTARMGLTPNDPQYPQQWALNQTNNFDMDAPEAWDITIGTPSVITIVLDDGIELSHADLAANIAFAMDFSGSGTGGDHISTNPCEGHGTNVAGCVAAIINNNIGVVGIAPGTRVAAAKWAVINVPCDGTASGSTFAYTSGVNWALTIGARATNTSYSMGFSSSIENAYLNTRNQGVVHFASTGNSGAGSISYPASSQYTNGIGAITSSGARASFSQYGTGIAFMAPGASVRTTSRYGGFATVSGTSFSSPYAAGNAAMVVSRNNLLTAAEIENILYSTCLNLADPGYDTTTGWGLVKCRAALNATPSPAPPGVFNLLTPANNATQIVRTPTFTWSASQFASNYEFMLADNPSFSNPIAVVNTTLTSYSHTSPPLAVGTTYYWKVHATNPLGARDSSPFSHAFTTYTIPPGNFNLTNPANGATNVSLRPSLQWAAANLAESYTVQVSADPGFGSFVVNANTSLTTYTLGSPLAPDTNYYWRVYANNLIGSTLSTPASRTFRTVATPPQSFNLQSPPDGSFVNTFTPTLNWSDAVGADTYRVQVSPLFNFSILVVNETGLTDSQFTIPSGALQNETLYYWRAYAVNGIGETASTPAVYNFSVIVQTCCPGNADKIAPGNVTFNDITAVLANFGLPGNTNGTSVGDADCNGFINFTDITSVLSNYGNFCP